MLAHELSHALADQNYNLARFIRQGRKSDDGASARLAVMEGQATWLMSEFLARKTGQSLKDSPALVAMMSSLSENGAGQYPVFESAPLYERVTLDFPVYQRHAVSERGFPAGRPAGVQGSISQAAGLDAADSAPGEVFRGNETHGAGGSRSASSRL